MKYRVWDKTYKYMDYTPGLELLLCYDGTLVEKYEDRFAGVTFDSYRVTNQYIIMFSIGVTDRNGKEIYEGDIIQMYDPANNFFNYFDQIRVQNHTPGLQCINPRYPEDNGFRPLYNEDTEDTEELQAKMKMYEVVGNIYGGWQDKTKPCLCHQSMECVGELVSIKNFRGYNLLGIS